MGEACWHGHHECESPLEMLTGTIEERRQEIIRTKPPHEHELRLRLLQPVRGKLPEAVIAAEAALNQAGVALNQAGVAYDQAFLDCRDEILALHAIECSDCPWDGHTIFPTKSSR